MNCKCIQAAKLDRKKYIESYYKPNMGKGLPDFKVLGWESKEAQEMRFEMLTANVNLQNKKILDVGCGLGNLLEYLNHKGINIEYTGVDIIEEMIETVKEKKLLGEFFCIDIFKQHYLEVNSFDVVYTSGIFNLNIGNNMEFFGRALDRFFELTKGVAAFNLLDRNSPDREDIYYYFDHEQVADMIEAKYPQVKNIKVVRGYLNNDFTVICSVKV